MPNRGVGPIPSRIMIVGEAWGADEDREGEPFVGASGIELNRMLHEANIMRSECFVSNVVNRRPPGRSVGRPVDNDITAWIPMKKKDITKEMILLRGKMVMPVVKEGFNQLLVEISAVQPNVILAFGNVAMWALTQKWGITNWRGSLLRTDLMEGGPKVIPSIHPEAVLREWSYRSAVVSDLRRVKKHCNSREYNFPKYNFTIRPSFDQVMIRLNELKKRLEHEKLWIEGDLETGVKWKFIKCIGLSWSPTDAICIPFIGIGFSGGYWSLDEETYIIHALWQVLTHKNARVRWQNGLFDAQYIYRHWHFIPRCDQDTMISQHTIFSDLPKKLSFQASLYSDNYIFWKDEGKTGEDVARTSREEDEGWLYNCKDCIYTREVGEVELQIVEKMKLTGPHEFQQAMFWPVLYAMNRGLKVREDVSRELAKEIQEQIHIREKFLHDVIGYDININSAKQMMDFFYTQLGQPIIMTRAKKGSPAHPTCDDEALLKISAREPLLKPITNSIADIRTLGKFMEDFVLAKRDTDGRMRCSFNIGGSESGKSAPKTYRLSSSKNAFGSGANLQTIPSEKSKSVGKWEARAKDHFAMIGDPYSLPNLRSMYGPDTGYTYFDMDLDRADLQVMAWDADEPLLKEALKRRVDLHLLNVYILDAKDPPPLEELVETHPKYPDHRGPRKTKREFAKIFCHATDYLGKARTVASHTGRTIHETERAQRIYLGTYSKIAKWQEKIIAQVNKHRFVENKFGYRWYIFDRIDDQVMPEAVAWIPQSTVSIVINRIWMSLFQGVPEGQWNLSVDHMMKLLASPANGIEVLLQVHDSLAGQFPTHRKDFCLNKMKELSPIVIPYEDPLIIPTGIGTSNISWGEC